jgi:hypothetical protein
LLSDLSPNMGPGWQSLDLVVRSLKIGLRSADFQKMPDVVAVLQSMLNTATELISAYNKASSGGTASPSTQVRMPDSVNTDSSTSTDADSQPSADATGDSGA